MASRNSAAFELSPDIRALKRMMREQALAHRAAIAAQPPDAAASRAGQRVFRDLLPPRDVVVAGFWSMGSEIDCRPILEAAHASGYRCCLPVVDRRRAPLVFRRWEPGMQLVAGAYGEAVPPPKAEAVKPDFLIVPGLAFDRTGFRLGYGAAYYDRTLAALRAAKPITAVGLAYSGQLVPEVPCEDTDEPLDWIVTEEEAMACGPRLADLHT